MPRTARAKPSIIDTEADIRLIRRLHRAYRTRWEIMGEALKQHLPDASRVPSFGGTSFWVKGPKGLDSDELGRQAGLSRSALHERFVALVGQPPMQYLSGWRMQLAAIRFASRRDADNLPLTPAPPQSVE